LRRTWLVTMAILILLITGCSHMKTNPFGGQTAIDWVDFVRLGDRHYSNEYGTILADPSLVTGEVVGTVKFKVADAVTNPGYRTRSGDAAFLPKGTKLYRIEGYTPDEAIAARDETRIGGYRLYFEDGIRGQMALQYNALPKDRIERIDLIRSGETVPYRSLKNAEKDAFVKLLEAGTEEQPSSAAGAPDPVYRSVVFYTDGPLAFVCALVDDGLAVYLTPDRTLRIKDEVRSLIEG